MLSIPWTRDGSCWRVIAPEDLSRCLRRAAIAPRLSDVPILMITADDGFRAENEAFARAVVAAGGRAPARMHMQADQAYSDPPIALEETVMKWLETYRTDR
jgi:hypothetical protein